MTAPGHIATGLALTLGLASAIAAQGPITATLFANDPISAAYANASTGTSLLQTVPAGPLTSASVAAGPYTSYACSLAATATGHHVTASSYCTFQQIGIPSSGSTHADLTLSLAAPAGTVVALSLGITHYGDSPAAPAFRVDLGDDGTVDVDAGCGACSGLAQHRVWTWDFANGPLALRILTDQGVGFGPQNYVLDLDIQPWIAGASVVAGDCGIVGSARNWSSQVFEITNYQLRAIAAAGSFGKLRANGLGPFGAFLVADQPVAGPLTLPPPFSATCQALGSVLFLAFGTVSAATTITLPVAPLAWDLDVPVLPSGLTFYVQHASAYGQLPYWFGTSNIVRIDT